MLWYGAAPGESFAQALQGGIEWRPAWVKPKRWPAPWNAGQPHPRAPPRRRRRTPRCQSPAWDPEGARGGRPFRPAASPVAIHAVGLGHRVGLPHPGGKAHGGPWFRGLSPLARPRQALHDRRAAAHQADRRTQASQEASTRWTQRGGCHGQVLAQGKIHRPRAAGCPA